jgi:cellulose synthase (UDP-forming)
MNAMSLRAPDVSKASFSYDAPGRAPASTVGRRVLVVGTFVTFLTSLVYISWWFEPERLMNPWLGVGLLGTIGYVMVQVLGGCFVYLNIRDPGPAVPREGLKVDVYVPVYDESLDLVEKSLLAVKAIRYPHETYLLDDRRDPELRALAERLGVQYRTRPDNRDAKAGNVNAALTTTQGDLVTIFDIDHVPEPDFLDKVLGYFDDPKVGFVQSGIGFRNEGESWIARAAVEQCADAYGPTSMGMHGCDAAPVWGSHSTFRRSALGSIGGYAPGLAEDLHTSLLLHVAGWKSVFVPEVTAYGLAPADMEAAVKQQFKWAHGVFDILFRVYRRKFRALSFKQNVAYALRCSYYLIGPVFLGHMIAVLTVLTTGSPVARASLAEYLMYAVPFAVSVLYVRRNAWRDVPSPEPLKTRWRGYIHTLMLWPVYSLALVSRVLMFKVRHISTPKNRSGRPHPYLVLPQAVLSASLLLAVAYRLSAGFEPIELLPMAFALGCAAAQGLAMKHALAD